MSALQPAAGAESCGAGLFSIMSKSVTENSFWCSARPTLRDIEAWLKSAQFAAPSLSSFNLQRIAMYMTAENNF